MSTFSGLNTALSGLMANQRAIDVTGQNVANANTDGYSRQRVDMRSIAANAVPAVWSTSTGIGDGVDASSVSRIRDALLEARAQTQHAATSSLTVQNDAMTQIQQAFAEPSTDALQSALNDMWNGWGDIASNSVDPGARTQLLARTQTVASDLATVSGALTGQWNNTHDSLTTLVTDVNSTAQQIAQLNQSIKSATNAGLPSNELQDKRDSLVLKLSESIGATSTNAGDGTLTVAVGGITLVSGNNAISLKVTGTIDPTTVGTNPPKIVTAVGGTELTPGGTAGGSLVALTQIIPQYQQQLDALAQNLAKQVNTAHANGYDMNGAPGGPVFDDGTGTTPVVYGNITAANISVAITDPAKLAAASLSPSTVNGAVSADHGNADALYQLRLSATGADTSYRQMIVAMGVQASSVSGTLATQTAVSTQVDSSRDSVSGVSIDEEMTNMLQFQHGYQAAGQLVSTINSMLDSLMGMLQ